MAIVYGAVFDLLCSEQPGIIVLEIKARLRSCYGGSKVRGEVDVVSNSMSMPMLRSRLSRPLVRRLVWSAVEHIWYA